MWENKNRLNVITLCVTWRKALRRVCNLLPTCHTEIVNLLNKNVPLFDDICKRSLKFIQLCMTSDNRVMNFIARHRMFYSRMLSVVGRNIQLCSERFKLSVSKLIDLKCNLHVIDSVCKKGKVFPYSLPSVGPGADPGVQAVSPQVT